MSRTVDNGRAASTGKRRKRRAPGSFCQGAQRCLRPVFTVVERGDKTIRLCAFHYADDLWARRVKERDGGCIAAAMFPSIMCNGGLQAMHLIPRGYHRTRWMLENGRGGCGAHHSWLTYRPLEHEAFCERELGPDGYQDLRALALTHERPDLDAVISTLEEAAA